MDTYSVAVLYKKAIDYNKTSQSLRLCHVEATNEDEAVGKALKLISEKDKGAKDMMFELPVVLKLDKKEEQL